MTLPHTASALAVAALLAGCGFQSFARSDAAVEKAAAALEAAERARLALVEPLLSAAGGRVERGAAERVRAAVGGASEALARLASEGRTPEAWAVGERAQAALRASVLRLMEGAERTPRLRADPAYRAAQARLEEADGRVAAAQRRLLDAQRERQAVHGVGLTGLHAGELAVDGARRLQEGGGGQLVAGTARITAGLAGVVGVAWALR
jgi:hypothetical protein